MKRSKIFSVIFSLVIFTACNNKQIPQTSATVSETESTAVTAASETTTETSAETEPAEAAEKDEPEYVEVSPNNEFIDFDFIEDYKGTDDIGDLADKAIQYLANEFIAKTTDWKFLFSEVPDTVPDKFADYVDGSGKVIPKFKTAYPNDYDGDGRTETFIVLNAPRFEYDVLQSYLVFADSRGNTELIDSFCREYPVQFLNYGRDKQIIFGGEGEFGVESHRALFGVKDGKAVVHYRLRGGFKKDNCFLSAYGWQGCGAMMYYDTAAREYRAIASEDIPVEEIKAMDSTVVFAEYYREDCPFVWFQTIGGGYYLLIKQAMMDWGEPYKYENGRFIKLENSGIRMSLDDNGLPLVKDIDIDSAIAEMKKPEI